LAVVPLALVLAVVLRAPTPVAATTACVPAPYRAPVPAAVAVPFSLPNGPFGAGNRGLEYRTLPGRPVRAIGSGTVRFAGRVAGERHVSIDHPDGLISSYSYLAELTVRPGQFVVTGTVVGTTTSRLQLGIRRGGDYLDPAPLLGPVLRPRLTGRDVGPPTATCPLRR
jgi:murein DD-endopeptidase MepM/ murein hydrolase activator NlpD